MDGRGLREATLEHFPDDESPLVSQKNPQEQVRPDGWHLLRGSLASAPRAKAGGRCAFFYQPTV